MIDTLRNDLQYAARTTVATWEPDTRYLSIGTASSSEATTMINAVKKVLVSL
jgi:hypothetical protein